ncbi:MAG: NTP transferase domain-containing protein [Solirubrobacterales bacterium]|nr:NTP transferase domain-containing protein [Solirubrobacterales bacterium]
MRAVLLAGGEGQRLRPYTAVLPKPLMPIGDRPIMDLIVRQLRHAGATRITVATGYLAELIEVFFGDGSKYGVPIDYFREDEPLGTAGALALIGGLEDDFLVMNGDVLTDLDYARLFEEHLASDAAATIATQKREVEISLGVLRCGDDGDATRLTDYVEKPRIDYQASMGVYCFSPEIIEHIEPGRRLDFPDLILRLLARGLTVRAWPSEAYWLDIGRHDDYELALDEYDRMRARLLPPP